MSILIPCEKEFDFLPIDTGKPCPPKPRRLVDFSNGVIRNGPTENNKTTIEKAGDQTLVQFEESMVDRAVSDLPNIASQVFSLNKDHSSEIKRQKDLLISLQEKVKEGEEKINEVDVEIKCVMNKIFMKEEETKDTKKRIKDIDEEIKSLITKVCEKDQAVSRTKEEAEQEIRNLETKLRKVQEYSDSVEQFEQTTSVVYQELQKTTQEVEELRELRERKLVIDKDPEETERLLSGALEKELESEIDHLKSLLLQAGNEAKLNVTKLTEERQKHKHLSQTIQVLHKRNAAQLTRLKRQVKELQTRNRQKQSQLSQLETNMVKAEKQLTQ